MPQHQFSVPIDDSFAQYVQAAILRLGYLRPELQFGFTDNKINVTSDQALPKTEQARIRKDILHQLYRERIYSETLSIRKWLYSNG